MRRGNYQGPRRVVVSSSMRRDWEEYDPRMEEYYDPVNMYTSGPGLYLPSDNLPYSIRYVEVVILHILSNIIRFRFKLSTIWNLLFHKYSVQNIC